MYSNISVNNLSKLGNINIIDIRSYEKYNNGHILDARNIMFEKLLVDPSKYINKKNKYYIYCQRGVTSVKLCSILGRMGYDVINVTGGYEAWLLQK